jgi:hypothetical protein
MTLAMSDRRSENKPKPASPEPQGPLVELTEIGEQIVIPGCKRIYKPGKPVQLGLWE